MTTCGSRVSGCSRIPATSASGSSASTCSAPAGQVDPDQPAGVRAHRADRQQRPAVLAERDRPAGQRVLGGDGQQRPPVIPGRRLADHDDHAAVGLRRDPGPDHQLAVGDPVHEPGVLDLLDQLAGGQVEPVDVVQLRVVAVQPDQDLGRELLVPGDQLGLHVVERRQVPPLHGLQVDVVQPPVLVPAGVLQVQQVLGVVRPGEHADAPVGVVGDHPRRGPVHAVRRRSGRPRRSAPPRAGRSRPAGFRRGTGAG